MVVFPLNGQYNIDIKIEISIAIDIDIKHEIDFVDLKRLAFHIQI